MSWIRARTYRESSEHPVLTSETDRLRGEPSHDDRDDRERARESLRQLEAQVLVDLERALMERHHPRE